MTQSYAFDNNFQPGNATMAITRLSDVAPEVIGFVAIGTTGNVFNEYPVKEDVSESK